MRLTIAAVLALLLASGCSDDSPGALSSSVWPSEVTIGHHTETDTPVGFGGPMMLINAADHDVTIDDVELVEGDGLSLMGWTLRDVGAGMATGVQEPFPPSDARPKGSNVVRPTVARNDDGALRGETELVIGVSADTPGRTTGSGIRITYTDEGTRHTITFPLTVVLCVPRDSNPDGCR